jgi:protein-S-isoprenylcysteine O-methyltransferase Ste14
MENDNKTQEFEHRHPHKNKVHGILAHSYSVYFILFLIGVYLDIFFKFKVFTNFMMVPIGATILVLGSLLILWAQRANLDLKKDTLNKKTFCRGPYCYTRSPTHVGLFLLMLGFGIISNAFFVILFTIISFIVLKFTFLNKQEKVLAEKYGDHYMEYKKSVRF